MGKKKPTRKHLADLTGSWMPWNNLSLKS